jgi:hypothetical protein
VPLATFTALRRTERSPSPVKRHAAALAVIGGLVVLAWAPEAKAHTKG